MNKDNIFKYIIHNDINEINKWLDLYPNDIHSKNNDGRTPLHDACKYGKLEIVKLLIEKGADINYKDNDGWAPLHWACYNGKLDIVQYLIDKGADVNIKNNNGDRPLHEACYWNNIKIVKYLIEKGADINCKNNDGNIPVDYFNDEQTKVINKYIRYIKLDSKIISLSQIEL